MTLRKGSRGKEVESLQADLKALGLYQTTVDGDFGPKTVRAVLAFQERYFLDGVVDDVTRKAIEEAVRSWANRDLNILVDVPKGLEEIERQFGRVLYNEGQGGYVHITNDFEQHVLFVDFPVVGRQYFHELLVPVLDAVMEEIKKRGLDGEIKQFGTWCPRHKMHDPKRQLSTHTWGIACDINWATNQVGTRGDIHSGIVDVFERHGFQWGGRWSVKDPMHFQYALDY